MRLEQYCGELLAGVDEVGRGCLAGDVVAAAVILDGSRPIVGLADSKKLSPLRREKLYEEIISNARSWSVARASAAEIDEINILQASLLAMKRAVAGLAGGGVNTGGSQLTAEFVAVDGNRLPDWSYAAEAVIGGDGQIPCISAASIIAKVTRDRELVVLDEQYPGYGFAKHKGYGTAEHLVALTKLGACPQHRRSFAPVRKVVQGLS
ncbi:MAG: ribonuclease HII [Porticoccaceae bacterium]